MKKKWVHAAIWGAALVLGGCAFTDEALLPSLAGEPSPPAQTTTATASGTGTGGAAVQTAPLTAQTAAAQPQITGTYVGQKAQELRGELTRLQSTVSEQAARLEQLRTQTQHNAKAYHDLVGAINAKLQTGTTPGNPILVGQWNQAQTELQKVNSDLDALNALNTEVTASAASANYLAESTQAAFGLSGAIDEDHVQLAQIQDDVDRTTVQIDRTLNELAADISRQNAYLATERSNLTALALAISNGEAYGASLATRLYRTSQTGPSTPPGSGIASGRPLVVIRFDRPNVQYEQPLFEAVSRALDRRPSAGFDIVAVAPSGGSASDVALNTSAARRDAEAVLRSLTNMGLPPERVSLSATTSQSAQSPEVHVYVR